MRCSINLPDDTLQDVSPELCKMTGHSVEEVEKKSFLKLVHPDQREEVLQSIRTLKDGELHSVEQSFSLLSKSNEKIQVRMNAVLIRDRDGLPNSIYCLFKNLSSEKKIRNKLDELQQQFNSLFSNNPHPVYYFDRNGTFKGVNDKLAEFTGYSSEELIGKGYEDFVAEEDLEITKDYFEKALEGHSAQYEIKVIVRGGEQREISVTKFPRYSGDEIVGVYGILQDITKEKQARRKLERSEQRFKSLFERNPDAVYSFDRDGNFLQANQSLEKLTGYTIDELKMSDFTPLVIPKDRERVWKHFNKALQGIPQTYESSGIHKEGRTYYVQVTNLPIYVDGNITGVFGIAHDITERKIALQKVKESEERWQQLVNQNPQPVQIVQDGRLVFINKAGADYYGADSPSELKGKPIMDFSHPEYRESIMKRKKSLENNEEIQPYEHKIKLLNGKERFIEAHSIPITYNGKQAIQTVIHDITELKKRQKSIGESLKEKEILLREIHHRVKNNLAMISSMLELQIMQSKQRSSKTALRDSQLRIRSIAMIHEKLYQSESLHDISFDDHLKELVQTIQKTYTVTGKSVTFSFDLHPLILEVNQVISCSLILNEVIVNSFKHAFEGKKEGHITVSLSFKNPSVELKVEDDGNGLPENFAFSEHHSLGMTLIQALSNQLDGTMQFRNRKDTGGTVFTLNFDMKPD